MGQDARQRLGRPTLEEAVELRTRILDQTLHTVRFKGSRGFSIDYVAALAGVTKKTIYRHFGSKASLIGAVVTREIDRLSEPLVDPITEETDPILHLRLWSKLYMDLGLKPEMTAFVNFLSFEAAQDPKLKDLLRQWHDRVVRIVTKLIEAAQARRLLKPCGSIGLSLLLIDLLSGSSRRMSLGVPPDTLQSVDAEDGYFEERWRVFLEWAGAGPDGR